MTNKSVFSVDENAVKLLFAPVIAKNGHSAQATHLPEILFITSYPPRECGIATYSQDLLKALNNKFSNSFSLKVCALESGNHSYDYPEEVSCTLDTSEPVNYLDLAKMINESPDIKLVMIQHEFGFFQNDGDSSFLHFLDKLAKPAITVFHTVLPSPDEVLKMKVRNIVAGSESIVVMTKNAAAILQGDYGVSDKKIVVIAHGTHLVPHLNKNELKAKYKLTDRKVLSTFGLLSSGKGIETTLNALPDIIKINPDVTFLVIGKTHPDVLKWEGEAYRKGLEARVAELHLTDHVKFINHYLPLNELLEYLQLTDIYLFTSKDPNQAVSGTFSYAMSCGCPIISTPIPHATEVLRKNTGIIIDFQNSAQLAEGVNQLMSDESLRLAFSESTLQRIVPSSWENSAIAHAILLQKTVKQTNGITKPGTQLRTVLPNQAVQWPERLVLQYRLPPVNLDHLKKMTTEFAMIQFSKINQPDLDSGYTLDDNARALIAFCMHYELTKDKNDLPYITMYLNFIKFCQQPEGYFLNYVDERQQFTPQNDTVNLADSNGRAIWAVGYLLSIKTILPVSVVATAEDIMELALPRMSMLYSTRAIAFAVKGVYFANLDKKAPEYTTLIVRLSNRLLQMYRHESDADWPWFESYMTYANSILPEALLYAWLETGDTVYKETAKTSFDFLLSLTFKNNRIKVISNQTWLHKGQESAQHGEQPIDVAYSILALSLFQKVFNDKSYAHKKALAFNWFLGNNHLHQIIYNPCTGGCYDGLEETHVNLNQGAESTVSYLMARLTMQKDLRTRALAAI